MSTHWVTERKLHIPSCCHTHLVLHILQRFMTHDLLQTQQVGDIGPVRCPQFTSAVSHASCQHPQSTGHCFLNCLPPVQHSTPTRKQHPPPSSLCECHKICNGAKLRHLGPHCAGHHLCMLAKRVPLTDSHSTSCLLFITSCIEKHSCTNQQKKIILQTPPSLLQHWSEGPPPCIPQPPRRHHQHRATGDVHINTLLHDPPPRLLEYLQGLCQVPF